MNIEPQTEQIKPISEAMTIAERCHLQSDGFSNQESFAHLQRVGKMFSSSTMVPESFRGDNNLGNVVIALEIAFRQKASPLAVMQNIYIVHGKPGWSSQWIIGCLNSCGRFSPLRFDIMPLGEKECEYSYTRYTDGNKTRQTGKVKVNDTQCVAWAVEGEVRLPIGCNTLAKAKEAGLAVLESPPITLEMAVKEGWYMKPDSKWQTMHELMLRYRAAAFFGRLYAPEILMGMQSIEEVIDVAEVPIVPLKSVFNTEIKPKPATPPPQAAMKGTDSQTGQTPVESPPSAKEQPSSTPSEPVKLTLEQAKGLLTEAWAKLDAVTLRKAVDGFGIALPKKAADKPALADALALTDDGIFILVNKVAKESGFQSSGEIVRFDEHEELKALVEACTPDELLGIKSGTGAEDMTLAAFEKLTGDDRADALRILRKLAAKRQKK